LTRARTGLFAKHKTIKLGFGIYKPSLHGN